MKKSLVVIPTFNEKENIGEIIDAVISQDPDFDVLIVDDNSPDGTAEIVRTKQIEFGKRVHLIERKGKLGLGTAYIEGFRFGLRHDYDYIIEMDADFSHDPKDLTRLVSACDQPGVDISIGSRYVTGGTVSDWPWDRMLLSRGASVYVRILSKLHVKDPTSGFICYHRKVLQAIDLDKIRFVGYAFQIEMKYAAQSLGFTLHEIPIIFRDRTRGESKMDLSIVREAIWGVIKMNLNTVIHKRHYSR